MKKVLVSLLLAFVSLSTYAKPDFEIPEIQKYESADSCRKDNGIALKTAKFYLNANLPSETLYSLEAARYIMVWIEASEDILVELDNKRAAFLQCKNEEIETQLAAAYMSGCVVYCLENNQKEHNFDMHYYALTQMLAYYEKNRGISGSDKEMDKLLKESKKDNFKAKEEKKFK